VFFGVFFLTTYYNVFYQPATFDKRMLSLYGLFVFFFFFNILVLQEISNILFRFEDYTKDYLLANVC